MTNMTLKSFWSSFKGHAQVIVGKITHDEFLIINGKRNVLKALLIKEKGKS